MSTKLQGPKATTTLAKATRATTNLRQTKTPATTPTKTPAIAAATAKSQKGQSAPTARSFASFSAPTTTRSINSTTSSVSSCNSSGRSISSNRTVSRSCTNTIATTKSSPNTTNNKRFITHTNNNKSSPFRSFITRGPRIRQPSGQANDFAYDLSKDESKFMGTFKGPMKAVPDKERELLKSGQRGAYLAIRYEHSPDRKYNYPEATSWRIGWFHNEISRQQGVAI